MAITALATELAQGGCDMSITVAGRGLMRLFDTPENIKEAAIACDPPRRDEIHRVRPGATI